RKEDDCRSTKTGPRLTSSSAPSRARPIPFRCTRRSSTISSGFLFRSRRKLSARPGSGVPSTFAIPRSCLLSAGRTPHPRARPRSIDRPPMAGFDALLLLAVGCFLAGVHLEAIFALVGVLLTATLFVLVKADQYLWILFAVGLAILAAIAGIASLGRRGRATAL